MIAAFVLKLVAGVTLMWLLMPRREVTDGFFRIQMLLVLGLCSVAVLTLDQTSLISRGDGASDFEITSARRDLNVLRGLQIAAGIVAWFGHVVWKLGRRAPGRIAIFLLVGLCAGSLLLRSCRMQTAVPFWQQVLSDLSSSVVLGAMLTGMLLGHWYLTTPTMSIRPLSWFTKTLMMAALLRLASSIAAFLRFGWGFEDITHMLWLSVRLAGGIFVPLLTAVAVNQILKYRNTQSATGVLFAGLILVFMGEMTATLLERDLQIPH